MDSAQPALLYIVPCTLLPVMFTACVRGEFKDMWDGDRETQLVSEWLGLRMSWPTRPFKNVVPVAKPNLIKHMSQTSIA